MIYKAVNRHMFAFSFSGVSSALYGDQLKSHQITFDSEDRREICYKLVHRIRCIRAVRIVTDSP